MPNHTVRLSEKQAADLAALCALGPGTLEQIAIALEGMPTTLRKKKIRETVAEKFGSEEAASVERALFGLAAIHRRNFGDASQLLESIAFPDGWDAQQREKWAECRPLIVRLLSSESVTLVTKALDLSFDVERFCVGARIITDIRPIFDGKRDSIVGSTIRQTLRLEYASVDGSVEGISIGLDAEDITRLKKSCEDAIKKVSVTQDTL